jgi:HEAT repeat protein
MLTDMSRRTPIWTIILAPVVLLLLVLLWNQTVVPLYRAVWYSDTVMAWRLGHDDPAMRISAVKDVTSPRAADTALLDELVARLQSDESAEVRKAAANSLGNIGSQRTLSAKAVRVLSTLVLTAQDDALLSAAIVAVGQSAANNRYSDEVVERIANVLTGNHLAWLYPRAATALGQVGATQALPDTVIGDMNKRFADSVRPGERESMADAFVEIAKGRGLPVATLDILADAFETETNSRIRNSIVLALAHSGADYPRAITVLTAAAGSQDESIVMTAESGLRIIEYKQTFSHVDPVSIAIDTTKPVETRLKALGIIRGSGIEPAAYEQIAALAHDPETRIATTAIEMFLWMARSPDDEFDKRVLIPALSRAMSNTDPLIRQAAYGALSTISLHRRAYPRAADFPALMEAGADDPEPKVRVVVLVMMLRDDAKREAAIERGMTDPDPYVRRNAASWLGSQDMESGNRQALLDQAFGDPDPDVRASAAAAKHAWEARERAWPIELWKLWQAGERGKVGMTLLVSVTVATPVLICAIFLIYYTARLLTYLRQKRKRAAAVVLVIAVWTAASYGMFMLFFVAGLAGQLDAGGIAILAGVLWGAIAAYAALGWGMHYPVRR